MVKTISGNQTWGFKAKTIHGIKLSNDLLAFFKFYDIQYFLHPFNSKYLSLFIQ